MRIVLAAVNGNREARAFIMRHRDVLLRWWCLSLLARPEHGGLYEEHGCWRCVPVGGSARFVAERCHGRRCRSHVERECRESRHGSLPAHQRERPGRIADVCDGARCHPRCGERHRPPLAPVCLRRAGEQPHIRGCRRCRLRARRPRLGHRHAARVAGVPCGWNRRCRGLVCRCAPGDTRWACENERRDARAGSRSRNHRVAGRRRIGCADGGSRLSTRH